jgi:AcrR family transcriptional regulator
MAAALQRRTQVGRRQEAERRILDAALELVAERGSQMMTLADVGERAGYSRALPAHYFGNKDGLVTSLASYMVERFRRIFVRAPKPREGMPAVLGRIDAYIRGAAEEPSQFRALQVLLAEASTEAGGPALRESLVLANRQALRFFAHQIRIAKARGEARADVDPDNAALIIVGAMRGALSQWFLSPEDCDLEPCRQELRSFVAYALAPTLSAPNVV